MWHCQHHHSVQVLSCRYKTCSWTGGSQDPGGAGVMMALRSPDRTQGVQDTRDPLRMSLKTLWKIMRKTCSRSNSHVMSPCSKNRNHRTVWKLLYRVTSNERNKKLEKLLKHKKPNKKRYMWEDLIKKITEIKKNLLKSKKFSRWNEP